MSHSEGARRRRLSPIEMHARLRTGLTEALVSRAGISHAGLNAFLRRALAGDDIATGALLSEQIFQAANNYVSSGKRPEQLSSLLAARTIETITTTSDIEQRFDYPAHAHQLESWQWLSGEAARSALVTSGTGSGKTECFLVPLLDDLIRQSAAHGRLSGVHAIILYPLNALIASQQERLSAWTRPLKGDVRFALYNGLMPDARASDAARNRHRSLHQVLDRSSLRRDPPPILVTNQTMLEYLTIRQQDRPILDASRGKLRWIIIDEAHSYIGSAAAELALLLRRVMAAFGVTADDVRFVATSATIGSARDARTMAELQRFLTDLAGIRPDRAKVIVGTPAPADIAAIVQSTGRRSAGEIARRLEQRPQPISALHAIESRVEEALLALAGSEGTPLLRMRAHSFVRAPAGLWSCINPDCQAPAKPANWPFGAIFFDERECCTHCGGQVFELQSCLDCGEPFLMAADSGDCIAPHRQLQPDDEFVEDSLWTRDGDADDTDGAPVGPHSELRLIGLHAHPRSVSTRFDVRTGEVDAGAHAFHLSRLTGNGGCPCCEGPQRHGGSALKSFRFGAPFLTQNAVPTILASVTPHPDAARRPSEGRQLISFADSRQGTARFAANIETNAERGFVRSFVYHAAQKAAKSSQLSADARADLEQRRKMFAANVASIPSFKDDIAQIDAQLAGTGGKPVSWGRLVAGLAEEPAIGMIAQVWDVDRSSRYHDSAEALANMLLLRELGRRPLRANAVETLGLARLHFPIIEQQSQLPELVAARGFAITDWRDFLYYMVDFLRGNFVIDMAEEDARWLPGRARRRNVMGPDQMAGGKSDVSWPAATPSGRQPNAVLLLAAALDLDLATPRGRHEVNDLLATAWSQLLPLLEGDGGSYRLRLRQEGGVIGMRAAWRCPVTRRLVPRLVFGRSPNTIGVSSRFAAAPAEEVVLPQLPRTFPRNDADARLLDEWVASDAVVAGLRARQIWHSLHDQAARGSPYLRAEEHSAQQPPERLREFEQQFRRGEINLLACSTTMEMGVDIGSIEAVLMTNVPPSIANYNQRAGRAGRRQQGFASSVTIARNLPFEREAFQDPPAYLQRQLPSPRVSLDSARIAQRHANAFLLAEWFRQNEAEFYRTRTGDFFGGRADLAPFAGEPPVDRFCHWLGLPSSRKRVSDGLRRLLRGTAIAMTPDVPARAARMFRAEADRFRAIWKRLVDDHRKAAAPAAAKYLLHQAKRLCDEFLLKELANRSLIPGSGFPIAVVPFDISCAATIDARKRRPQGEDGGARSQRYGSPTRNADIAIREYAPGADVVVDGLVWKSAGVALNWQSPIDSGKQETQSLRWLWACAACGDAGSDMQRPQRCPSCGEAGIRRQQFLEPAGFRVDWLATPHVDTDHAFFIEPVEPQISAGAAAWRALLTPASGRIRGTSDGHVFHCSAGVGKNGYDICLECGRAEEAGADALDNHRMLSLRNGREPGRCPGNDNPHAVVRGLLLGHEEWTDVVEIQLFAVASAPVAWAIGSALRQALTQTLGIEAREIGVTVSRRAAPLGRKPWSIFLYDKVPGGAGYASCFMQDIASLFAAAREILDCDADCRSGCSGCVLAPDLHRLPQGFDREGAYRLIADFVAENQALAPEDRAVADAAPVADAADALVLRARAGDEVKLFLPADLDLAGLAGSKMRALFTACADRGARVVLVLAPGGLRALGDVERRQLRNLAIRHELAVATTTSPAADGSLRLAEVCSGGRTTAWFSRDPAAAVAGPDWGTSTQRVVVEGSAPAPTGVVAIAETELEHRAVPGARVKTLDQFPPCAASRFGAQFVQMVGAELKAAGLWRPGDLAGIDYVDRYLATPLSLLLALRACAEFAAQPGAARPLPVAITTRDSGSDHPGAPYRIFHNWADPAHCQEVGRLMGAELGLDVRVERSAACSHGRRLTLRGREGRDINVFLDQGFGYWRLADRPASFRFDDSPLAQARALLAANLRVHGVLESYFAISEG